MKRNNKNIDAVLDDVTAAIRSEAIDPVEIESAAGRVWARIASERHAASDEDEAAAAVAPPFSEPAPAAHLQDCADFQTLIPAHLRGELSAARALLLEDHTLNCLACRKRLRELRFAGGGRPAAAAITSSSSAAAAPRRHLMKRASASSMISKRWAIAAAVAICCGLAALLVFEQFAPFGGALGARVQAASGSVYRVSEIQSRPVTIGEEIKAGERIRTAKDSVASVRLADGSSIEMKERSELSLSDGARGVTVNLERGNVIVQAARQRDRQLYVATDDCLISVTGTIFSVNSGTKGSRISVIEGEVRVNHAGAERTLHPGDQTTTHASLDAVPLQDEIAWSRDAERYVGLLNELTALRREVNAKVARPGVRYASRLLNLVPEETVLYAALPNISAGLSESYRLMRERINQNAALREWWEKEHGAAAGTRQNRPALEEIIDSIRECGEYLGSEIVVTATMGEQGQPENFLVLAELNDQAGFRAFLERQVKMLAGESTAAPIIRFIDDPTTTAAAAEVTGAPAAEGRTPHEILIWAGPEIFAAAPRIEPLRQLAALLRTPPAAPAAAASRFAATPFHARIADIYRDGAGLIVAADLEKIIAQIAQAQPAASDRGDAARLDAFRRLGLLDLKHFIAEQKEVEGKTANRAMLTFDERTQGIASWLAAPGPMGALEFISPDANVVAAFVVKEPTSLVGDLLGFIETAAPEVRRHLNDMEARHQLDLRRDFAAPLGGEFAFAIDGPILPLPSWKVILEVYDPARLQQTLERVVEEINREAVREGGQPALAWERAESSSGRPVYTLRTTEAQIELHYTYVNGYLVAAPSRTLVERAIRFQESKYTLLNAPRFAAMLPADGNANFSALFFHDLTTVVEPFARRLAAAGRPENPESPQEEESLQSLGAAAAVAAVAAPTLAYAYASGDRIIFATNSTESGLFGLSPASLFGLPGSLGIQHIIEEGIREKEAQP